MRYLLDSNVIIGAIVGRSEALQARMAACDEDDIVTSAVAYAEVAHGSLCGKPPPMDILDAFMTDIPILAFDAAAGRAYATLPFVRGSYDRLIAAHALAAGLTVVTSNDRDFAGIPALQVENWTR